MDQVKKSKDNISANNLLMMLKSTLEKEKDTWKPIYYTSANSTEDVVGSAERNSVVEWFLELNERFQFNPETVVLCIAIFDKFISVMKVKPRYRKCVAVSCFFIAIKTMEEDEVIPTTAELLEQTQCTYSVSDILRMEKIILLKFNWNSKLVASLEFVHITKQTEMLAEEGFIADCNDVMDAARDVMDAVRDVIPVACEALLSKMLLLWLRSIPCFNATATTREALVGNDDLIHCREVISETLSQGDPSHGSFTKIIPVKRSSSSPVTKSTKRKVEQIEVDEIYDSIKRLYNEDLQTGMCATQVEQLPTISNPALLQILAT
ncbi:Cyclin-I [Nymphon striatum]|nr:Cyclin-I [Nymphon striatum]